MSQEQLREALSPCPHCGKTHTVKVVSSSEMWDEDADGPYMHTDSYAVICDASAPDGPGGCGACSGFKFTVDEAVQLWNTRATQPEQANGGEAVAQVEDWPNDRTPIGIVPLVDLKTLPIGAKLYTHPAPAASAEREARVIEQNARKAAQEQLYAERERHTAEVKRLQAEIGRLKATAASVSDAVATVRERYRATKWGKAAECICDAVGEAILALRPAHAGVPDDIVKDAQRWRHARDILCVEDIERAHDAWEWWGRTAHEIESLKADAAIDAAIDAAMLAAAPKEGGAA